MKKFYSFILFFATILSYSQEVTGDWYGNLSAMGSEIGFVFQITKNGDKFSGTMSVPQQNANGIPLSSVTFNDNTLTIKFDPAGLNYSGKLNNRQIDGTFSQNGMTFPLVLTREKPEAKKINRPQEPKAPFPYESEEVTFENSAEKITLAGTFTYPKTKNFPVVILISGSGQQDRNAEIFGHKPFWVIADYLTRNGVGVLRIDDRGVGKSGGDPSTSTSLNFASDIEAAFQFLKKNPLVNAKKIGLIGHSEGGMIAPIVAAKNPSFQFIVLLAAPGIPCDELLLEQSYLIGKSSGMNETDLLETKKINQQIYTVVKSEKSNEVALAELESIFFNMYKEDTAFNTLEEKDKKTVVQQQISPLLTPWYRYFIRYRPEVNLEKITCPVLVLNGEKDLQVPPQTNVEGIKKALLKAKNKSVTTKVYPNLNHLFQECKTGSVEEYGTIEQTFSPQVLQDIKDWIIKLQ
ncbi:MAG: alpha/beta fold hydrolase [Flavobacteriales bacterium]|nr:alpha/beta fold hydrolase [Flavobacteriales bacterium]